MFDIAQNQNKVFESLDTGVKYHYRPVPYCYKTEIQQRLSVVSSGVISQHAGNPEAATEAAKIHAAELMIRERAAFMLLLLRVTLRSIEGVSKDGAAFDPVELVDETIGGITTKAVSFECISGLLDGPLGEDLARLTEIVERNIDLSEGAKKKSTDNNPSPPVRVPESVQDLHGDVQENNEAALVSQ